MNDDSTDRPSRTQLKRQAEQQQAFGERLITLPEPTLARLPLPEKLLDAVRAARDLNQRGALRRQRQYIGRLMRELDTTALEDAMAMLDREQADENARFHEAERWRDRLVEGDSADLEAFFDTWPGADRQRLRQLVSAARDEVRHNKPPRRRRELYREIRQTLENGV